jgi:outer membrane protein assembly factor BamB
MTSTRASISLALLAAVSVHAGAADWPQFRGPGGQGIAANEKNLPVHWDDNTNLAWKVELPGPGSSSPIVVGDHVLVTCYSGYGVPKQAGDPAKLKRHLLCFDRAGKLRWQKEITADAKDATYGGAYLPLHGYASSTPASDGKYVYVFFGVAGVVAYDLDGKQVWRTNIGTDVNSWGGAASSPILYKDLVIVNAGIERGGIVALDRANGHERWFATGSEWSWSTPHLVEAAGHAECVVNLPGEIRALDPARGTMLWTCRGTKDFYVVPAPVAHDGIVFAIGGRDNMALAVKAGGKGQVDALWRIAKGSNVSSPVYHNGHVYYAHESGGVLYCVKASDGEVVYEKRLEPEAQLIYASATLGDGKIYYVSRTDGVYVVEASPTFNQLAHNRFKGDTSVFNGSPAIADGRIYLRSDRYLYCIGK